MTTEDAKRLYVAMELLRGALTDNASAMEKKAQADNASVGRGGSGTGAKAIAMLTAKFAALAGPLAVMGATLSATNSGFSVLGTAVKALGAVLAPILLPVVVLVATALLELSRTLWAELQPRLKDWYEAVVSAIPAVLEFVRAVARAAGVLWDFGKSAVQSVRDMFRDPAKALKDTFAAPGKAIADKAAKDSLAPGMVGIIQGLIPDIVNPPPGKSKGGVGADGESKDGPGPSSFDLVIQSLEKSLGGKASFGGISQAAKNAQLAALNTDPIEAQTLRVMLQSLNELKTIAAAQRAKGVTF